MSLDKRTLHPRCPQNQKPRYRVRNNRSGVVQDITAAEYHDRVKPVEQPVERATAVAAAPCSGTGTCPHRGEVIDKVECPSCCGRRTMIKVYQCSVHGRCTVGRAVDGIHCCGGVSHQE